MHASPVQGNALTTLLLSERSVADIELWTRCVKFLVNLGLEIEAGELMTVLHGRYKSDLSGETVGDLEVISRIKMAMEYRRGAKT